MIAFLNNGLIITYKSLTMLLSTTHILDGLDWIPIVSTGANLFHIFKRVYSQPDPSSSYGLYFRKITIFENIFLLFPIVNIFIKAFHTYRNTKSVILQFCRYNGLRLAFAPYHLTDDMDVVRAAVFENPNAIQFASDRLKNNPEISRITKK